MTIIKPGRLALQALLLTTAGACAAGTITCVPGPAAASAPSHWIRRIAIDEHSRTVNMDIVRSRTKDTETIGYTGVFLCYGFWDRRDCEGE